jgi:hypothetical protein
MEFDPRDLSDARERDGFEVHELRWGDDARAVDGRERDVDRERAPEPHDPREPFVDGLKLPRSVDREFVQDERQNLYELNREDSLMLATIGAFRVVRERDLEDFPDAEQTLEHLREEGLVESVQIGAGERADVLTADGLSVLEANRGDRGENARSDRDDDRQAFYAGVSRARELQHDSDLFRAYRQVEKELREQGADVQRIVLEVDLRREYQQWLQEHNCGRSNSDGRPDRDEAREGVLGSRARPSLLRRARPLPRLPHRVRARSPKRAPRRGSSHRALSRRPRQRQGERRLQLHRRRQQLAWWESLRPARCGGLRMTGWTLADSYESVRPSRVEAVRQLGFSQRQATFLAHVLVFSGVFMERQYCRFAGLTHGRKSCDFLRLLVDRGYATVVAPGRAHAGRLYHLHHKPLYEAVWLPNSRHRRRVALGRFIERLMLLDVVLGDKAQWWLGTEKDKVGYFQKVETFGRTLPEDVLPRTVFGTGDNRTTRYFPDKLPIGIAREADRRHLFVFLVRQPSPSEFRIFLARHAELLAGLFEWTIRLVIPTRFEKAKNLHLWALRDDLTKQLDYRTAEEFRDFLKAKHQCASAPANSTLAPSPADARRFASPRFRALERVWLQGVSSAFSTLYMTTIQEQLRLGRGRVEVMVLPHKYLHLSSLVGVA